MSKELQPTMEAPKEKTDAKSAKHFKHWGNLIKGIPLFTVKRWTSPRQKENTTTSRSGAATDDGSMLALGRVLLRRGQDRLIIAGKNGALIST